MLYRSGILGAMKPPSTPTVIKIYSAVALGNEV